MKGSANGCASIFVPSSFGSEVNRVHASRRKRATQGKLASNGRRATPSSGSGPRRPESVGLFYSQRRVDEGCTHDIPLPSLSRCHRVCSLFETGARRFWPFAPPLPACHSLASRRPPSLPVPTQTPCLALPCLAVLARRLRMNSAHYEKMKELFRRAALARGGGGGGGGGGLTSSWTGDFHDCLFACLMRYEALQVGRFAGFVALCASGSSRPPRLGTASRSRGPRAASAAFFPRLGTPCGASVSCVRSFWALRSRIAPAADCRFFFLGGLFFGCVVRYSVTPLRLFVCVCVCVFYLPVVTGWGFSGVDGRRRVRRAPEAPRGEDGVLRVPVQLPLLALLLGLPRHGRTLRQASTAPQYRRKTPIDVEK